MDGKVREKDIVSKLFGFIFYYKTIWTIGGIGVLVFLASLWNRYIYIDDAFFGEQAYYLAKEGVVKTASLVNFLGCDVQLFSYHKLNIFVGAGLIKLFGWHITPLRVVSIVFILLLVFAVKKYFLNNRSRLTKEHFLLAVFFLLFNPLILLYAFTYRPEIWVTFFGFYSFVLLDNNIRIASSKRMTVVFAGLFAGLAFLTHLNGLIFLGAGFWLLIICHKYREAFIFSIVAGIVSSLYFWDLWQPGHMDQWLFQMKHWPDNNATNYLSTNIFDLFRNVLVKLSHEHQRFFWSYKSWGMSLFFFLSIISNFKYLIKEYRILLIYTFLLVLILNVAGSQIAERYVIYYYPFMAIIISIGIVRLLEKNSFLLKVMFVTVFVAQIVFYTIMTVDIFKRNADYVSIHKELESRILDKTQSILVPYQFVFNMIEDCHLVTFKGFEYYEKKIGRDMSQQEVFARADSMRIHYIIIPNKGLSYENTSLNAFDGKRFEPSNIYKVLYVDNYATILERVK